MILSEHVNYVYFDQDALNVVFADNFYKLPAKFNHFGAEKTIDHKIYHYAGGTPHPNYNWILNRLWFSYFAKTPFFNMDSLGNLWKSFETAFHDNQNQAMKRLDLWKKICKLSSNHLRAFYTYPENVEKIRDIFGDNPRDLFFNASNPKAMEVLKEDVEKFRGKRIYLLWVNDSLYKDLYKNLINRGSDFFDIRILFQSLPEWRNYVKQISRAI